jgi:predicted transposase YdaD
LDNEAGRRSHEMNGGTTMNRTTLPGGIALLLASVLVAAQGQAPQERVAALKQSLQESHAKLRTYEWIETTAISLKGEEKSRKQNRCYYGADGKVQKVPIDGGAAPAQPEP